MHRGSSGSFGGSRTRVIPGAGGYHPTLTRDGEQDFLSARGCAAPEELLRGRCPLGLNSSAAVVDLTYSHIGIYIRAHGKGGDNFGCVQRCGGAAAARDSGLSGAGREAGGRSGAQVEAGAAFGLKASASAARCGPGEGPEKWKAYAVSH